MVPTDRHVSQKDKEITLQLSIRPDHDHQIKIQFGMVGDLWVVTSNCKFHVLSKSAEQLVTEM